MWVSSQLFYSFLLLSTRGSSSSSLSAIKVVSSAYQRFLIFLPTLLVTVWESLSWEFCTMYSEWKLNKQVAIYSLAVLISQLEPGHCSTSSPNCCFLIHIQVSQEAGQVVWYSYLFKNFPQFVVIHTVKGFSIVNETDVFLEFSCFFCEPVDIGNLISGSSVFSK